MTIVIAAVAIIAALLVLAYLWLIRPVQEAQERTLAVAESERREAQEPRVGAHASA